jgi:hypothetical protein
VLPGGPTAHAPRLEEEVLEVVVLELDPLSVVVTVFVGIV